MPYAALAIPIIVAIFAQVVKLSIDKIKGNLNLKSIWLSYGGMPSAHTAFAVSVTTVAGLWDGWDSPLFAVAAVFTLIIMRDAMTFRNFIGEQGKLLNHVIGRLPLGDQRKLPHFMERVGHAPQEVLAGAAFGFIITWLLSPLLF
ncbi:MAG: divergent PAP2 family protein [Patescibacteria group bacterium]|nr:divergent PAP2 family protein [Patescibacteria group bacterium]